jgi:hypothetical protein
MNMSVYPRPSLDTNYSRGTVFFIAVLHFIVIVGSPTMRVTRTLKLV